MNGHVTHWQMLSRDPGRAAEFYAALFGWKVSADNGMGYRMIDTGGGVPGGLWPVPPEAPEAVQLFAQVEDIDAALARCVALGGRVVVPKQVLPDGDTMALALDPLGRSFGLTAARA